MKQNSRRPQLQDKSNKNTALPTPFEGDQKIISERIVHTTIQKESQAAVQELLNAELSYFGERLELIRKHAELHPDAIEDRKTKSFRRQSYGWLLFLDLACALGIYFSSVSNAVILGIIAVTITIGVLFNARERDIDFVNVIQLIDQFRRKS